ncbi:uncharacterized protein CUNH12orf80 [Pteropus alecto]|uniref:uncharacterized protein CUNH12orf80 n=1 Tax=Pteropus alecto TaxID=9402 RepID=UPI000D537BC7|nr:uncharacterized protein CUNH12orf80 [Pteropus alecto]
MSSYLAESSPPPGTHRSMCLSTITCALVCTYSQAQPSGSEGQRGPQAQSSHSLRQPVAPWELKLMSGQSSRGGRLERRHPRPPAVCGMSPGGENGQLELNVESEWSEPLTEQASGWATGQTGPNSLERKTWLKAAPHFHVISRWHQEDWAGVQVDNPHPGGKANSQGTRSLS